ncbi:hypothetical protein MRX96_044274 [Rhipicephalus microplus]
MVRTPKVSCSLVFRFVGHVLMEQPAAPRDLRQAGVLTSSVDAGLPYHVCADTLSQAREAESFRTYPGNLLQAALICPSNTATLPVLGPLQFTASGAVLVVVACYFRFTM